MILSDDEALARLGHGDNLANWKSVEVQRVPHAGRTTDSKAIPLEIRALIGGLARQGSDTNKEIAETFGVSAQTVSDASRGLVGNRRDEALEEKLKESDKTANEKVETAHAAALDLMMESLIQMKPLLKEGAKLRDLSKTAADMAKIAGALKPAKEDDAPKVQVVLMSVNQRKESEYEVIDA